MTASEDWPRADGTAGEVDREPSLAGGDPSRSGAPPTVVPGWARWLCRRLFPSPAAPRRPTPAIVAGYSLGFAAAAAYLLIIPAGRSHLTRIYGEDGVFFLQGALKEGLVAHLFTPLDGYLHLLPRLGAEVVALLPLTWWAAGLAVTAALARAAMAVLVYAATSGHIRSRPLRFAIAASLIVLPSGNGEALNNLANLHWFVVFAAFWTLLWRPVHRWQNALAAMALFLFVATTPMGFLLAPLAAVRLALPRRRDRAPAIVFFIGLAVQFSHVLAADRGHNPIDTTALLGGAAARGPMVTLTGPELAIYLYPRLVHRLLGGFYSWPAVLALIVVVGLAGVAIVRGDASRRLLTLACLCFGGAVICVSLYANWRAELGIHYGMNVQRYSAAPGPFFFAAIALGLAERPRVPWRYAMMAARLAVVISISTGVWYQWHANQAPLTGITWSDAIAESSQSCDTGMKKVQIRTIPEDRTSVTVRCSDLP